VVFANSSVQQVRVLDNLADEMEDTVWELESRTEAQVVGIIGRTLLLYQPSLRKFAAAQAAQEKLQRQQRRARTDGVSAGWVGFFVFVPWYISSLLLFLP
jgi:RNA-binding protein YhbY